MVEVKLDIPDWESYSTEHYLSVRVGEVQKLTRISAPHRTFRIPASAVGNRRYAKVEVFRRVGNGSICIDTEVAKTRNDTSVEFEGKQLQYSVTVNPLKGDVKAAPIPLDKKTLEEKSNPKLMDAKDYLERHHMEARLSEAMQAVIRSRPPDPALFLAEQLATNAGVLDRLPRKQDPVKEELERLRGLFPGCSLDSGASSSSTDLYPRAWVKAPAVPKAAAGGLRLHVAQFNVLADGLSGMCAKQGGFTDVPAESLAWRYRRGRLVEELFRHGVMPDVITMQEVDHFFDWFQPVLEGIGYEGRFLAKPDSPCRKSLDNILEDGCALFWKKEVLSLRHLETIRYGAATGEPGNQVALVAELRPLDGTHPLVLATTHLSAKKTSEGEQARSRQASELLELLRLKGLPCVLGMDMNAAPSRNSCANYDSEAYPAAMRHSVGLRSAYAVALGAEPGWTTWKRRGESEAKHTIDYILTSGSIAVERVLAPPADYDVAPERLPGWRYPSDHVALLAELCLPKAQLSGPFDHYVKQNMRACEPKAMLNVYSKFPLNHSAKAAAAAKHARMCPPIVPFREYYRGQVTSLDPELLSRMHNRFPAARRAAELRVSGSEVLSGVMPHFGIYYKKHIVSSASSSALEKFHERQRQRAAEEAAKKIPAPLLNLSWFLYYKRHCVPTSTSSLKSLYGKFRRKPKPVVRRKPEPLVSLSYFLYYNRYVLPSSTPAISTDLYRRFGRGHLEPKAGAPPPPIHSSSRGAQALLAPTSPTRPQPPQALPAPTSPAGGHSQQELQAAASKPRVAPGDSATASPISPTSVAFEAAAEDSLPLAPPWAPPEGDAEPEAHKEVPPLAPEEEGEEPPHAPSEEEEPPALAPEEQGEEPPVAPEEALDKHMLTADEEPASAPSEEAGLKTLFREEVFTVGAEAVRTRSKQVLLQASEDGTLESALEVAISLAGRQDEAAKEVPPLAPAEEGPEPPIPLAPAEEGEEPPTAPAEAAAAKEVPPLAPAEEGEEPPIAPEEARPQTAEDQEAPPEAGDAPAAPALPPALPGGGREPPAGAEAAAAKEAPPLAPAEEGEEPPIAPEEARPQTAEVQEAPPEAGDEPAAPALPPALPGGEREPPAGAEALQKHAPPAAESPEKATPKKGKASMFESSQHEICRALLQELYFDLAVAAQQSRMAAATAATPAAAAAATTAAAAAAAAASAAAAAAAAERPPQPQSTFEYRLEPKDPVFSSYYSEHVLEPYGPDDGFAALHALFAASPSSAE